MEARHLRYALALAEHGHFGRAAASLGIAQPPLSTQIAALEREVGERLFDRTARGVFPTAAGEAFLAHARSALTEMTRARVDAGRAARGETGRLRIGFIGSALLAPLPGVIGRFRRTHPEVQLSMEELDSPAASAALLAGELDVAVGRGSPRGIGAEDLVTVPIGTDHLVAVVSTVHPFAGRPSVDVEQLAREPLVVSADAAGSYLRPCSRRIRPSSTAPPSHATSTRSPGSPRAVPGSGSDPTGCGSSPATTSGSATWHPGSGCLTCGCRSG